MVVENINYHHCEPDGIYLYPVYIGSEYGEQFIYYSWKDADIAAIYVENSVSGWIVRNDN